MSNHAWTAGNRRQGVCRAVRAWWQFGGSGAATGFLPVTGLDRYFGLSEGWWLRLETECELRKAKREVGPRIAREVKPRELALA